MPKGANTRLTIIHEAREIWNTAGIGITIDMIAREMGVSKSRISNHFPTKDSLFIAILGEYEKELASTIQTLYEAGFGHSLQAYANGLHQIMDVQYKYRCGIIYLNVLSPSQHELKSHTASNYARNLASIRQRMELFYEQGLIVHSVLEEPQWSAFVFVYINLLTQWVIHLDMYDNNKSYLENKKVYISGILKHLYAPYLTEKGKRQMADIML